MFDFVILFKKFNFSNYGSIQQQTEEKKRNIDEFVDRKMGISYRKKS